MSNLSGREARNVARAVRQIQAAMALELREKRNPAMIADPKIRATDRIMQRWAVGHGTGLPPEDPGALSTRVPQLDDQTQIVIDRIITHKVPDTVRKLVCAWYRTNLPCSVIAKQRGMTVRSLYRHWELVLEYLREIFLASGHPDLVQMLRGL